MSDEIRPVSEEDHESLVPLLDEYPHVPFIDLRTVKREAVLGLQRNSLRTLLSSPDAVAFVLHRRGRLAGLITARKLAFDTELFGFPCYSVSHFVVPSEEDRVTRHRLVRTVLRSLKDRGAVFVSARANALESASITAMQEHAFTYMDTTMRYAYDLTANAPPELVAAVALREAVSDDIPTLVNIAATYTENRFHYDPRLPREKADAMYRLWLENSFKGDADWIVVATIDDEPVGFTTNKNHPELPTLGGRFAGEMIFSAVSPAARGRDVYTSMIHAGLVHFHGRADLVYLGCLASNVAVQRAWQRLGFRVTQAACSFHRWLREPDAGS